MKKMLFLLLGVFLILSGITYADIWDTDSGAPVRKNGSKMANFSIIGFGTFAGDTSGGTIPAVTDVDLAIGDVLVMTTSTTNGISVSKTTTAGDELAFGVVVLPPGVTTATALDTVQVAVYGVVIARSSINVSKGDLLTTSGTAGKLTATSSLTADLYTGLSRTPNVVMAIEDKTFGAGDSGGLFRGVVIGR